MVQLLGVMRPGKKWWRCFLAVISGTKAPPHSYTWLIVRVNDDPEPEQTCLMMLGMESMYMYVYLH